jgi:ParB/RepB/Spo0J family partition protein
MAKANTSVERSENEPLSALELPAAPAVAIDTRDVALDNIQQLRNIRPHFQGIESLAETMHVQGLLEPCCVRPAREDAEHAKAFELVYGYRRYLAAESLGWSTLRCEVREVSDEDMRRQIIIENFQRDDLTPVGVARAMYELKYSVFPPLTNAEVARQLGCDPSQVSHLLTMLIKLAPPRAEGAPPLAHEVAKQRVASMSTSTEADNVVPAPAPAPSDEGEGTQAEEDVDEGAKELDPSANMPLQESATTQGSGPLVMPGDPQGEDETPPELDILALVDAGTISASTAEIIASLDTREDHEQLTKLVLRHGWGAKKAAAWVRDSKKSEIAHAADDEELGPVEMINIADVTPLQSLRLRVDVTDEEIERIVLYAQLRNGMDQEMLDFIAERLGYQYESLWEYVSLLSDDEVAELKRRMAVRYVCAAHRFFALEPSLKDALGLPEDADNDVQRQAVEAAALALPGQLVDTLDLDGDEEPTDEDDPDMLEREDLEDFDEGEGDE